MRQQPKPHRFRHQQLVCSLAVALSLYADVAAIAQVDALQLRLLTQFELPLRWDNVEPDKPYWIKGIKPRWYQKHGFHAVHLEPGESLTLQIPAGESLRLHGLDAPPLFQGLQVWLSNGSGLYRQQVLRVGTDNKDALLTVDANAPQLARVVLPVDAPQAIDVALFVSRREPLPTIAPYRRLLSLPGTSRSLRRATEAAGQAYWSLNAASSSATTAITVTGPARLALRNRLQFPANESALAQMWRIEVQLDDNPWTTLEFDTAAENAQPLLLDGREVLLSREKEAYLEIPDGDHQLRLRTDAPVLLRLLQLDEPDYLLPDLNGPMHAASDVRNELAEEAPPVNENLRLSEWNQSYADATAIVASKDAEPMAVFNAATRLYRDNHQRDSSLLAATGSRQNTALRREMPALQVEANEKAQLHTAYRDLLPLDTPWGAGMRFARYLIPSLNPTGAQDRGIVIASQHENRLLQTLGSGYFLPVPPSASALGYSLPDRFAPSSLQLAVHGGEHIQDKLYVQFDEQPAMELQLSNFPELKAKYYAPSSAEAALAMLAEREGTFGLTPAPLIPAGVLEIPLPQAVSQVRLWREVADDSAPAWVAVKLRVAKPYALTERAYLEASRHLADETMTAFLTALKAAPPSDAVADLQALDNHWQPLIRLLRAQAKLFSVSVNPLAVPSVVGQPAQQKLTQALQLEARGQWLPAFEAWSAVASSPDAHESSQALTGQIRALRQMGEDFLAEQMLKQAMLNGQDEATRRAARQMLVDIYRQAEDHESLQLCYAAALQRDPDSDPVELVSGLVETLLNNGEAELALDIGLLLPQAQRPLELLLRAAYANEWWQVFEDTIQQLPDTARQHFWRGQRALRQGNNAQAVAAWQLADAEGRAFAQHMQRAQTLFSQFVQGTNDMAWGQWLAEHPGPRLWQDATPWIQDFAGTESLYAIDRDSYFSVYRSEPDRPLRLRLAGPMKLRIEARPLHSVGKIGLVEGWLRIQTGAQQWQTPITQNAPASGLVMTGRPEISPGRRVVQEVQLGTGWHDVSVDGDGLPLLLRVQIEQPELRLPYVPLWAADMARKSTSPTVSATDAPFYRSWLGGCPDCSLLLDTQSGAKTRYLRLGRNLLTENISHLSDDQPKKVAAAPMSEPVSQLPGWPDDRSAAALRQHVTRLLWIAEHQPEHAMAARAQAEALRTAYPQVAGFSALVDRMSRNSRWTVIERVHSSAGLRSREILGWEPEAPALRVRRALLPPLSVNERLLSGKNRLVLAINNPQPAHITLNLGSVDVAGLPPQPLTAVLQIDAQPPQRMHLTIDRPQQTQKLRIPSGRHSLRLWLEAPYANQFLRLQLIEVGRPQFAESVERFYHVATHREPVRLTVFGPNWLRIDEWRDGRSESRYQWIEQDSTELVLTPPDGRNEALYRLHQLTPATGRTVTPPRTLNPQLTPVPPPSVVIVDRVLPDPVVLDDGLPLGGQEDGTWSLGLSSQQRLFGRDGSGPLDENSAEQVQVEKFVEYSATHRYFDADRRTHFRTDLLARQRDIGNPSFGLQGLAAFNPRWSFWNLTLDGSLFAQNGADGVGTMWAWNLGATATQRREITPKLEHSPQLALFWRGSQVGDTTSYRTGHIDQDIYTPYRDDHRYGISIGETLNWLPWLDSKFYAGAKLIGNPDFNPFRPDHLAATLGWRQLLAPFRIHLNWGSKHFFADAHRSQTTSNQDLNLDLGWEYWLPNQERIEVGLGWHSAMDVRHSLLSLGLTWNFGNGRAYKDFREVDFLNVRQRRVPPQPNNRINE